MLGGCCPHSYLTLIASSRKQFFLRISFSQKQNFRENGCGLAFKLTVGRGSVLGFLPSSGKESTLRLLTPGIV